MDKCVCDICSTNTAVHKFKAKRLQGVVRDDMHVMRWVRIDVCEPCYHKLLRAKEATHD